jgi:hypothetical protein
MLPVWVGVFCSVFCTIPAPLAGAEPSQRHWAFLPLSRPALPRVGVAGRVRNPVDAFVMSKLEEKSLHYSTEAGRETLLRRIHLDLLGLPPSPEEAEAFLGDAAPDACERLLDRLLASPHYGERWGRHWLDAAGYVDVLGDELSDWRSARQFTPQVLEWLVATGFLRTSADDTDENELNTLDIRHGVVQRTAEVLAGNLLGLTLNCAKCHDHKYEPVSQRDYYRLQAVLQPAFNPQAWLQPKQRALADLPPAVMGEIEKHNAALDGQIDALKKQMGAIREGCEDRLYRSRLATLPEPIRDDTQRAVRLPPQKRNEVQKYLAGKFGSILHVKPAEVTAALTEQERTTLAQLEQQIAERKGKRKGWASLQVVYDTGPPTPTRLLHRGNHEVPREEVPPGVLEVLAQSRAAELPPVKAAGATSGRRLALATWLTDWDGPAGGLVLRVYVNRVWQRLFGRGIVETTDNLGVSGARPSHPELLEWLAGEFRRNGRQLKPLLRLILTSAVYRQASALAENPTAHKLHELDPDNQLLGRMRLRRLESEIVRDSLLAVSGKLDRTAGGPPVPLESRSDGTIAVPQKGLPSATAASRRSVYLLARRHYHATVLGAFDQPLLATHCTCRQPSTVVSQALTMLNDRFVLEQAGAFAERVARSAGTASPEEKVELAFRLALVRRPKPRETTWSTDLLTEQKEHYLRSGLSPEQAEQRALTHLCHMLLNTSEFLCVP